jgi:predicted dehydrogenase
MRPNIVLVGCGAIARTFYLPALASLRSLFGDVWLVDPSEHALSIAQSIVSGKGAKWLKDVNEPIDLVIIATPNKLHFDLALEALSRGAHVLLEKPFVIWPEQGRVLIDAYASADRVIAINQTRRLFPVAEALRRCIEEDKFGRLKSIVHREGTKLVWPFESGAGFAKDAQRTGVIMDFGVHVVDFYHFVLGPNWTFASSVHDGFRGPEGLAEIELLANDATVSIRLSRYYPQENVARLLFERAEVCMDVYGSNAYTVRWNSGRTEVVRIPEAAVDFPDYGRLLLLNFLAAAEKREPAVCDAVASLPVIDVLDETYRQSRHYPMQVGYV